MSPRLAPYGEIELLKAEVNRLIELLLRSGERNGSGWHPAVDVMEDGGAVIVQVELPGVRAEELELRLQDRRLSLRGRKRRLDREPSARRFHLMERFIGGFVLHVELPELVDPRRARARLEEGVLTVHLPRLVDQRHTVYEIPVVESRAEGRDDD